MSSKKLVKEGKQLTVRDLKSLIAEHGFEHLLTSKTERKSFYVNLYDTHVFPRLEKQASTKKVQEATPRTEEQETEQKRPIKRKKSQESRLQQNDDTKVEKEKGTPKRETRRKSSQNLDAYQTPPPSERKVPATAPVQRSESVTRRTVPGEALVAPYLVSPPRTPPTVPPIQGIVPAGSATVPATTTIPKPTLKIEETTQELRQRSAKGKEKVVDEPVKTNEPPPDYDIEEPSQLGITIFRFLLISTIIAATIATVLFLVPSTMKVLDIGRFFSPAEGPMPRFCDTNQQPRPGECIRCPLHAVCLNGKVSCEPAHALYLKRDEKGNVIEGSCEKDELTLRKLREAAHELLAERAGAYQCEEEGVHSPGIPEQELKEKLQTLWPDILQRIEEEEKHQRPHGRGGAPAVRPSREFESVFWDWKRLVPLHSEWNIHVMNGGGFLADIVYKTDDFVLPFWCDMRLRMWEFKWYFAASLVVVSAWLYLARKSQKNSAHQVAVNQLVTVVKEMLREQKRLALDDMVGHKTDPFLPHVHVRDSLFHDNHPSIEHFGDKQKMSVWADVVKAINRDRRVRTAPQLVDGEQQTTWEWVASPNLESPRPSRH